MGIFPGLSDGAKVTYQDLVDCGLVDQAAATILQSQYDKDNANIITADDLLDMMCPNGYRSREGVETAVDKQGRSLVFARNQYITGWIVVEGGRESDSDS